MLTCDEFFEKTVDGWDELDPATRAACEEHARGCEDCRRLREGIEAYDDALANPGKYPGSSPELRAKILQAAADHIEKTHPPASRVSRGVVVAAILVGAALIGASYLAGWWSRSEPPLPPPEKIMGAPPGYRGGR